MLTTLKRLPSDLRLEADRRRALAREREQLRRAGARLASEAGGPDLLAPLREEVHRANAALAEVGAERRALAEAETRDLGRVSWWIRPAVVLRALSARVVLQDERRRHQRVLDQAHEALARAAGLGGADYPVTSATPVGGSIPGWAGQARREAHGLTLAVWGQLRSHLFPKAPALVGMAVGWWIANTYTDSRVRSLLHSVGIGSGGTHVVSGSTYRAMSFWLPLFAAALCAYAGERIWQQVVGRDE